jgi:actin-related protein
LASHVRLFFIIALPQILVNVLEKVDLDLQFELFNNIVLSGGNTMFENFSMKFIESLRSILPDLNNCRVKDVPKRDILCWQGANILADHSLFGQINITP